MSAYTDALAAHSPLATWWLEDVATAGLQITDESGNARHGAWLDGATTDPPGTASTIVVGGSASADMLTTHAAAGNVTHGSWMNVTTAFTLLLWIRPDATVSTLKTLLRRDDGLTSSTNVRAFRLQIAATGIPQILFWLGEEATVSRTLTGVSAVEVGEIYMLAFTFDGSTGRFFINGTEVDSEAASGSFPVLGDPPLMFIEPDLGGTEVGAFDGSFGHAAYLGSTLTPTQIGDLYEAGASAAIDVGQTAETDSAFPMTHLTTGAVGQASETDIAFPMSEAYVGNAVVEIAFNAGYSTPAASRTWTDVSDYVEAHEFIEITYGRQDEFSTCDANTCRVTLDNSDGRFTARRASSPYYPNVKIGRPLRVTVTRPGGSASTRFIGYIDDWPLEWDGASNYAKTQISATSRMARLGGDRQLKSIVEEEVLEDGPAAYYTLGEPEGATTAADSSGNSSPSLVMAGSGTAVVFGTATGPGTDGLTAATFAGKYLTATLPGGGSGLTLEFFFSTTATSGVLVADGVSATSTGLQLNGAGKIADITSFVSASAYNDGQTHHAAMAFTNGGAADIYVDGVSVGTTGATFTNDAGTWTVGEAFGVLSHVTWTNSKLSAARIAAHANAGLTGFAGETPGARVARYATQAAVPAAEINADAGTSPMAHVDTTGQSTMDMLRVVETTENGVLHDARDNTLRFHDRTSRYLATSAFTLSMTAQQVENGFVPKVDRTGLLNDVTATLSDGTVTARAVDQASVDDYGRKDLNLELATTDENEPHAAASWRVNTYAEPRTRIPAVSVDILPLTGTLQDSVLAADVGTRFAVTGIPSQAETTTGDFFVEGYTESIGPASHMFTFNVSDPSPFDVWTVEDPVYGAMDEYPIAY